MNTEQTKFNLDDNLTRCYNFCQSSPYYFQFMQVGTPTTKVHIKRKES